MDDIITALNKTSGCDAAMKVFAACEHGASGDVDFGAVVEKKCEADFLVRLKASKNCPISARCGSATASTGTSPAPCICPSRRSAGPKSPSAIHIAP
jgi:hypothetical protein